MPAAPETSADRPSDVIPSKLNGARERLLAQVVEHSLQFGRRTAADFIRHFPPAQIMSALGDQPKLRAKILGPTTGVNERIALKKSAGSAGEDLEIALKEGVTSEQQIMELFQPDDRVRFLDHQKLWEFLTEGEFWNATRSDADNFALAKTHVEFIVECARDNALLTDRDIVDGCTLTTIVERLPKHEICMLFEAALLEGRAGKPFKDEEVMALAPPSLVLEHVPLKHVWSKVIVPKIAVTLGFVKAEAPAEAAAAAESAEEAPGATPSGPGSSRKQDIAPPPGLPKAPPPPAPATKSKGRSKRLGALDLSEIGEEAAAELEKLIEP